MPVTLMATDTESGNTMVDFIIRWSLHNRLMVCLTCAALLALGGAVTMTMPVDVLPDLTAPTVPVIVEGHGMSPQEMETLVTFPIESAVNGASGVRRVRSDSSLGIAVIWVEFEWGVDIFRARQIVTERLATVEGRLPPQVEAPVLAPIASIMGVVQFLSLSSDRHSDLDLRTVAITEVRRRLLAVEGVAQVVPMGGDLKQYQVVLDPRRLLSYGITLKEVTSALAEANENVSAGLIVRGGEESIVEGIGRIKTLSDIENVVISVRDEVPVKIRDLGTARFGAAFKRGTACSSRRDADGNPVVHRGVILTIQKQPDANTLALVERIDATVDSIQTSLPDGMVIHKDLFRQSDFISAAINNTVQALIEGGLMVILVVVLFLFSSRASLITLLAIPMSLVVAILVLKVFGASVNTMTLGGMAIAIGALVDDAIIDVENVVRRLRENHLLPVDQRRNTLSIVFEASVEIRSSIVFATLIILLVFSPLFFLSGVEGRLLFPLGLAFAVALFASLLTALTLTPALCWYLLPGSRTVRAGIEPRSVSLVKRIYRGPLAFSLRHPWLTAIPAVLLFGASLYACSLMGRNFLPEFNEGSLVLELSTVPGTSLQESDELIHVAEGILMQHPEIVAMGRRTGRAEEDEHVMGVESSELEIALDMDAGKRQGGKRRSKEELLEALRADLSTVPGLVAIFGQPISHRIDHMLSGTRASIAVKIFGENLTALRNLASQVESSMRGIEGVVDLSTDRQTTVPSLRVVFDRTELARHGIPIQDTAATLRAAFIGETVGQVFEGKNAFDLVVRLGDSEIQTPEALSNVMIDTASGQKIPLKVVADLHEDRAPNKISREDVQRKIVVQCNVSGRDVTSVVNDIRSTIESKVEFPKGYYVEFGGQFESAEAANRRLLLLSILVIILIGALLHVEFGSLRDSLLTMINMPLALIGGVAGVYISGGVLSVASIIGFITVFGIAARNGIMMVSHIRHLQESEGVTDFAEAVRRGAMERVAPILMTALASGLALIPLALKADEPGTEILTPMANVILFGLLSSTFLNMLVLPALYLRLGRPARPTHAGQQEVVA